MNKKFIFSLILSVIIHAVLFVSLINTNFLPKMNFSQVQGKSSIKAKIAIYERAEKQVRKKSNQGRKRTIKKTKKIIDQNKSAIGQKNSGQNSILAQYLANVRSLIAENKIKTRIARKLKMTGLVKVGFTISRPNKMTDLHVIEKSQFKQLDDSALRSVTSVSQFPVIPDELDRVEIPVVLVITYK